MPKYLIPLLAFVVLCLLGIPAPLLSSKSDSPGWHTTIYPSYYRWALVILLLFLFFIIGHWLSGQKATKLDWTMFFLHLLISLPAGIFIRFPTILARYHGLDLSDNDINDVALRVRLIPIAEWTFMISQGFFLIYFLRNVRKNELIRDCKNDKSDQAKAP